MDPDSTQISTGFLCIKPSRIILGARIDQPNEAAIKGLAQKISVPVINARLAKDRFEIEFK